MEQFPQLPLETMPSAPTPDFFTGRQFEEKLRILETLKQQQKANLAASEELYNKIKGMPSNQTIDVESDSQPGIRVKTIKFEPDIIDPQTFPTKEKTFQMIRKMSSSSSNQQSLNFSDRKGKYRQSSLEEKSHPQKRIPLFDSESDDERKVKTTKQDDEADKLDTPRSEVSMDSNNNEDEEDYPLFKDNSPHNFHDRTSATLSSHLQSSTFSSHSPPHQVNSSYSLSNSTSSRHSSFTSTTPAFGVITRRYTTSASAKPPARAMAEIDAWLKTKEALKEHTEAARKERVNKEYEDDPIVGQGGIRKAPPIADELFSAKTDATSEEAENGRTRRDPSGSPYRIVFGKTVKEDQLREAKERLKGNTLKSMSNTTGSGKRGRRSSREDEEEKELEEAWGRRFRPFKAREVPASTSEMLWSKMEEEQRKRREEIKATSKEQLQKATKPFTFYERDLKERELWRRKAEQIKKEELEQIRKAEPKIVRKQGTEKDISTRTLSTGRKDGPYNVVFGHTTKEKELQSAREKLRPMEKHDLLKESALPPRMEEWERTHGAVQRQQKKEYEKRSGLTPSHTFKPKINRVVPDHVALANKFMERLEDLKQHHKETTPQPFHFHTAEIEARQREKEEEEERRRMQREKEERERRRASEYKPPEKPQQAEQKKTYAQKQREKVTSELLKRRKEKEERERREEEERQRRLEMAKNAIKDKLISRKKELEEQRERKIAQSKEKRSQQEQMTKEKLKEIEQNARGRPYLFEHVDVDLEKRKMILERKEYISEEERRRFRELEKIQRMRKREKEKKEAERKKMDRISRLREEERMRQRQRQPASAKSEGNLHRKRAANADLADRPTTSQQSIRRRTSTQTPEFANKAKKSQSGSGYATDQKVSPEQEWRRSREAPGREAWEEEGEEEEEKGRRGKQSPEYYTRGDRKRMGNERYLSRRDGDVDDDDEGEIDEELDVDPAGYDSSSEHEDIWEIEDEDDDEYENEGSDEANIESIEGYRDGADGENANRKHRRNTATHGTQMTPAATKIKREEGKRDRNSGRGYRKDSQKYPSDNENQKRRRQNEQDADEVLEMRRMQERKAAEAKKQLDILMETDVIAADSVSFARRSNRNQKEFEKISKKQGKSHAQSQNSSEGREKEEETNESFLPSKQTGIFEDETHEGKVKEEEENEKGEDEEQEYLGELSNSQGDENEAEAEAEAEAEVQGSEGDAEPFEEEKANAAESESEFSSEHQPEQEDEEITKEESERGNEENENLSLNEDIPQQTDANDKADLETEEFAHEEEKEEKEEEYEEEGFDQEEKEDETDDKVQADNENEEDEGNNEYSEPFEEPSEKEAEVAEDDEKLEGNEQYSEHEAENEVADEEGTSNEAQSAEIEDENAKFEKEENLGMESTSGEAQEFKIEVDENVAAEDNFEMKDTADEYGIAGETGEAEEVGEADEANGNQFENQDDAMHFDNDDTYEADYGELVFDENGEEANDNNEKEDNAADQADKSEQNFIENNEKMEEHELISEDEQNNYEVEDDDIQAEMVNFESDEADEGDQLF
ncbi:putative Uncharacterized protein family UPF0564 [Monocercomonoides exilis]|uniref:putative Uncharacterized protein family UPF0564 n=1 Tax=Monocercomonoides exilis TaxID=2049356 RepID=UPI0035599E12|nr:putative Uncharacterized protein family UPF0564 [Monocercomonoides exilis]|eukprot:MONOS_3427.1-p1 / transcript=MONOS_3427.1 / gene=MONOS_3427 / organism=Monocercomonoides_exilis_PA203 / gene_product=unspecified product / transcript_product=unspecified product / location=Mono_scaffold00080:126798-131618(+) / protein_length=1548 / sequence_SO=supercontig / SO=protein_coding / is_pseudo=false